MFADIAPDAVISQEEIFGPVLAVIKVESFEEGLKVANNTEYGLTGALYTSDRGRLEIARREFHVGNLYLNRKCTGAMVGAHPFGGFNMSGTDSKAGGPDYLSAVHAGQERGGKTVTGLTPARCLPDSLQASRFRSGSDRPARANRNRPVSKDVGFAGIGQIEKDLITGVATDLRAVVGNLNDFAIGKVVPEEFDAVLGGKPKFWVGEHARDFSNRGA